ncbi:MAG: hypothetical protein IJB50_00050 [Clostridia bacterium]|nr:hypothetical protein [Clostridia bacterium]
MRKVLTKFCDFLEKKLYDTPTYEELQKVLDRTRYRLYEAQSEISRLQMLLQSIAKR